MKKRSTTLVALIVICTMLLSGFAVTAAVDPATTYSFEESFDVAKTQAVSAANVAEAYSQFVTLKVEGEDADAANLSIEDSKISASAATTYSVSSAKAVPMTADYVVDFDVKRTGANGKKAVYVGFRVPSAHATLNDAYYFGEGAKGVWFGMGTNFAVAPVCPEDATTNFGTGKRWQNLRKDGGNGSSVSNHTHFRAYDDAETDTITIYMVNDDESEEFYASMTIGAYNETDDVTPVTYVVRTTSSSSTTTDVLNIPGQIYSGEYCYPQMVVNSMKPEIGHFGVTGAGLDDAGLTTLKINGVEEDVATYNYDGIDPLDGGVITVEAEASWAADYTLYTGDSQTDEWTETATTVGLNTIEVAGINSVKLAVNTCNGDVDYIINLSDNNPGEVTASPEAGQFEEAQEITLTGSGKDNAEIYYTTDGTDPKENGILYETPFTVPANAETTVKAVEKIGSVYGSVAEFVYDIFIDVEEPAFDLAEGDYLTAKTIALSTTEETVIYYTLDGTDPSDEENVSRVEYTTGIELALVPDVKTTYVVKAVAFRDDTYSEVVTKTYGIGVQKEKYTIDPTKIVSATDPNFKSHDGTPDNAYRFYLADSTNGWFGVEKGADNTYQWEKAVLKNQITEDKQGYQIDFDVKNMDTRSGTHQALNVYLRQNSSDIDNITAHDNAYIIVFMRNTIGIRNASWGNHCSAMLQIDGMDLANETHITITDDFVTDSSIIYVDGEPVAYGKISGATYTLTAMATGESVSKTQNSTFAKTAYPGLSLAHTPAQIKDFKVTVGRPDPLNILTSSTLSGQYEDHVDVEITKYNDELTVYYTVDGSDPLDSSNENRIEYLSEITISETCTLKVAATDGTASTEVYSWDFEIIPYQPGTVVFSIETGEYPSAQELTLTGSGKTGAVIYYTTDGSDPVSSDTRTMYISGITIPNNAETTVKAVEVIDEVSGTVVSNTYYTGTVSAPALTYNANMQQLVIGQDSLWKAPDNRTAATSFDLVADADDTIMIGKNEDGSHSHSTIYFDRSMSSSNKVYKMEMYIQAVTESSDTYRAVYIEPRSNKNHGVSYIINYDTPRFAFQAKKIGIRTGNWGKADSSTMMEIPGMNLNTGGKIEFVDDMLRNIITIYVDGKLVVVAKISGGTITLTAVETGEQIVWNGSVNSAGYPRIYVGHCPAHIKNLAITYPYTYDLPVILSHNANSYIGEQNITITNYFETPVYYTLDGSDPADVSNPNRVLFNESFTIGMGQTTVKAVHYIEDTDSYGGYIEKIYKIYESEEAVIADIETLVTEELTIEEQKIIIDAVFGVAEFTISKDSYYNELTSEDVWVKAFVEVLKEAREAKGSELDFADAKKAAYRAAVVAYFMDSIERNAVAVVVAKANDRKQQYKMDIPLVELGFDSMPANVQNWILQKIKDNPMPNTEELYNIMYETIILSAVTPELADESDYSKTERAKVLTIAMNKTDILTEDEIFARWGKGSKKQNKAVNKIIEKAEETDITTIEGLKVIVAEAISEVREEGGNDGPSTGGGGGGGGSFSTNVGSVVVPEVQVKFADAKTEASWAYEAIIALSDKGVVSGYEDRTFRAGNSVTREEYVKMLVVALGIYDETAICLFTDTVNGNWYDSYIASAVNHGIVNGISETEFGVGANITRQDMAVIAYRAITSLGKKLPDVQETVVFSDEADIADYAGEAVNELQQANIINGMGDGTFAPGANANRAQAAYIIYSILNAVEA